MHITNVYEMWESFMDNIAEILKKKTCLQSATCMPEW